MVIIYAVKNVIDIPVDEILAFQDELFEYIDTKYPEILASIRETKQLDEETEQKLIQAIQEKKATLLSRKGGEV